MWHDGLGGEIAALFEALAPDLENAVYQALIRRRNRHRDVAAWRRWRQGSGLRKPGRRPEPLTPAVIERRRRQRLASAKRWRARRDAEIRAIRAAAPRWEPPARSEAA